MQETKHEESLVPNIIYLVLCNHREAIWQVSSRANNSNNQPKLKRRWVFIRKASRGAIMPSSSASSRNVFINMLNENKYKVDILCFTKVVMLSFLYVLFFFFFNQFLEWGLARKFWLCHPVLTMYLSHIEIPRVNNAVKG